MIRAFIARRCPGMHDKIMEACAGSYVTREVKDVRQWLNKS